MMFLFIKKEVIVFFVKLKLSTGNRHFNVEITVLFVVTAVSQIHLFPLAIVFLTP